LNSSKQNYINIKYKGKSSLSSSKKEFNSTKILNNKLKDLTNISYNTYNPITSQSVINEEDLKLSLPTFNNINTANNDETKSNSKCILI
jgi:hypothetical protein